jgi:hypothetical protein
LAFIRGFTPEQIPLNQRSSTSGHRPSVLASVLVLAGVLHGAGMSDPRVDAYNLRLGTQTFSPLYQFTSESKLLETARAMRAMGSDIFKGYLGPEYRRQNGVTPAANLTSLTLLARDEPSMRQVLGLPFRHYILWTYPLTAGWWADGYSATERQNEYSEMYTLCRYFLTNYNNSGKRFYLGHWEGDWHLLGNYDATRNPTATAIQGMRDWLNNRQRAVDDARAATVHTNVEVYLYTEVNRVRDAMANAAGTNQRVVNEVVPHVTNLDFVSWSSYDGQDLSFSELMRTLDYIESKLPTNKVATIAGKRVFVGEYGWGGSKTPAQQEPLTRTYMRNLVQWGCPFVLFWEMYNNETDRSYYLIDPAGQPAPCYDLHQRFFNQARLQIARFLEANQRLPTPTEFESIAYTLLARPFTAPVSLTVSNLPPADLAPNSAALRGTLTQGVYGDDWAEVIACWGTLDGGTNAAAWAHRTSLGENRRFAPATFATNIAGLEPDALYRFRLYARTANQTNWAAVTASFSTPPAPPRLELQRTGGMFNLTWPESTVGFTLWATTNLTPPIPWAVVIPAPPANSLTFEATATNAPTRRFFRLACP